MGKLEGKIALITGGNSGIGLATAQQFVNEGAYIFITGRRGPELAAAVKEIGRNVTGVPGDGSNLGDLDRLFAQIKREKGKLDIGVCNATISHRPRRCGWLQPLRGFAQKERTCGKPGSFPALKEILFDDRR